MYIVGSKNTHEIVNQCGCVYNSTEPDIDLIKYNIADIHGGTSSDYAVYDIDDNSEAARRIFQEDAIYELLWTPSDEISGVDFSEYDTWNWIHISASKYQISATGTDLTTITFTIFEPDGETIDTSYTKNIEFNVRETTDTSGATVYTTSADFTSGIGTILFARANPGEWEINYNNDPSNKLRVKNKGQFLEVI